MKIGLHVSIAGGIFRAPKNAYNLGCETFQIFSRSPAGGPAPILSKEVLDKFKLELVKYNFDRFYMHTPYYINLASRRFRLANYSRVVIEEEVKRGDMLGAVFVMTHLGSAKDVGEEQAIKQTAIYLKKVLSAVKNLKTKLLIEMSAGSGQIIGDTFEEIKQIRDLIGEPVGVCYDLAHGFASGYDIRTKEAIETTLKKFDQILGLDALKLIHSNDSLVDFNSKKDRHANIGQGKIGLTGFKILTRDPRLQNIDWICETPREDKIRAEDVKILKKLRD